ncbi:hypothetical protein C2G38_780140 [Gigaspora rosea]|uniref:Uncharacterized protein n=1 Tax=Gigaspora rosea TaxID=44941 RepID=A0A397U814_9GLOM|nr:hypothetical protein C2G38_780140 [Gigaspora rosea]
MYFISLFSYSFIKAFYYTIFFFSFFLYGREGYECIYEKNGVFLKRPYTYILYIIKFLGNFFFLDNLLVNRFSSMQAVKKVFFSFRFFCIKLLYKNLFSLPFFFYLFSGFFFGTSNKKKEIV